MVMRVFLREIVERLRNEPVLLTQGAAALLSLLTVFGLGLNVEQGAAVMAVAQVLAGVVGRAKVTPTRSLPAVA